MSNDNGNGRLYEITVKDKGIGFDGQYAERVFDAFQRLHDRYEYEGSGIGLSVCKKIVERHKGSILAKSAGGKGATFIIHLPVENDNPAPREDEKR